jgi:diguanylate cyclase (GGDEF)-like protein
LNAPSLRTVLVVDDDEATRTLIVRWLTGAKLMCMEAPNGEVAIDLVRANAGSIDAVVLDVMMPGLDGFEVLRRLKHDPLTAHVPVVILTAHATADTDIVTGVDAGAFDHIAKPFSGPVLVAKVRAMCERARQDRELRRKLMSAEAHATIDALTNLGNRRSFEKRLKEEAAHARRHREPFALVLLDIDHFKVVNDTFGHEEGDRVLVHVADAMRAIVRVEDGAFRYGGEEFSLVFRACDLEAAVAGVARLHERLRRSPIELGDPARPRVVTFSAGVASATEKNAFHTDDMVARADAALYRAKRAGRDRTEIEG